MRLRDFKLNAIFYLSFGIILGLVTIIAAISLVQSGKTQTLSHYLYQHIFLVNKNLHDIETTINWIQSNSFQTDQNMPEINKREDEIEESIRFLYQNYTGPRSDIDSANVAYASWKPNNPSAYLSGVPAQKRFSQAEEITQWLRIMTIHNFNTVDIYFDKAQKQRIAIRNLLELVLVLTFIFTGVIIYINVKVIKTPIQELTRVTQQFSSGNYKVRSTYQANNEMGVLADAFNKLASSVDRQYQQLREQSQTLGLQKNELVKRYNELAIEKERAESADRLKSAFLLNMSHELRTPLNSVIGFSGILLQQLPGPLNQEQINQLRMIQLSGRHLLSLINDILDLSKIEAGEMKPDWEELDINEVIQSVVNQLLPAAREKGLSLKATLKLQDGKIVSDKKRITQVLINLVNNAVKFTARGFVHITCCRDDDSLYIDISDTGIGIREEDLKNLFTPFLQLENNLIRKYEGSGLGLSISRKLVEMLQGKIMVKSKIDVGTTFTIILPTTVKRSQQETENG